MSEVGEWVSRERRRRSWTLRNLATRSECSISMLSEIEHGSRFPSLALLSRLERVFDVDAGSMIRGWCDDKIAQAKKRVAKEARG
jgi:transcriptional regulator with XRE-family HTH domain